MKYSYAEIQQKLPALQWSIDEFAEKLSVIGHEAEVDGDKLDITLTSNRKDCQKLEYLLFDLCGIYPELAPNSPLIEFNKGNKVDVTIEDVNKLLGSNITETDFNKLNQLGFKIIDGGVIAPDFRIDIATKADIAEEITRLIGFEAIKIVELSKTEPISSPAYEQILAIKEVLVSLGFTETQTPSFSNSGLRELKNPFTTDEPYMRPSLEVGLLHTLSKNPYLKRAMFFELGDVFKPEEETCLGLVICGYKDTSAITASLKEKLGITIDFKPTDPNALESNDVKQARVQIAEIRLTDIPAIKYQELAINLPLLTKVSKFPPLVRDISVPLELAEAKDIAKSIPNVLLIEQIDSFNKDGSIINTYRILMQKFDSSFTEQEINAVDETIRTLFHIS